jgi:hypothetical protein
MAGPVIEVEAPTRVKREGGIEQVAEFRKDDRLGAGESVVFQSAGCSFPKISEHLCYTGEASPDDKTYDGIGIDDAIGEPFPLYSGIKCTVGPDADELERAKRQLEEGRGRELEAALFAWAAGATAAGGGVVAGVAAAIGRVEQVLDNTYVGKGVILMSRYDATLATSAGTLELVDGQLQTKLGTHVIASGRVTPATVYGTGAVLVLHGDEVAIEAIDPEYNQHYAIAEAVYVLAVDCEFRTKSAIA